MMAEACSPADVISEMLNEIHEKLLVISRRITELNEKLADGSARMEKLRAEYQCCPGTMSRKSTS